MTTFIVALILFAVMYVLLFSLPKYRAYVALASAVVFTAWLSISKNVDYSVLDSIVGIDYNVLMMIAGTMGIVALF
ncbi:MAG: arsenic transporter, partial [Clostridia bacterium]|nr:arsenic transporter [Clostridia bacterium]